MPPCRASGFAAILGQLYHRLYMGQLRRVLLVWFFLLAAIGVVMFVFNRPPPPPPPLPVQIPRIASATPAGTNILIGIGAGDTLVAVSDFDDDREGIADKPRIGDYDNIDWEKLAAAHPNYLLLQEAADRISEAVKQRCTDLGIQIVNLKIDDLRDIESTMEQLAIVVNRQTEGEQAVSQLQATLAAIQSRVAGRPSVRTLIVTSDDGLSVAGPGEFLDELLSVAGGQNVAANIGRPYASLEPEMLASMAPDVVIQLIPDGDQTPQVLKQAGHFWLTLPDLPAVKNNRVYVLTDWYALQPGSQVASLAQEFANILHPDCKP